MTEWNIDNDSGGGDGNQYAPEGFDPGAWIGATSDVVDDCGGSGPDVGCDGVCFSEMEFDWCGECGGDGSSCNILGDVNGDGLINVLDVVMLVNAVLDGDYSEPGDMNQDGVLDVLDIVTLVNIILS